ncbi:MAG: hypothetical protein QOH05_4219, partial [Acetobacteraceae bacterium]|nr:hypothetical protein [Acetobacteraceae bacterium]
MPDSKIDSSAVKTLPPPRDPHLRD